MSIKLRDLIRNVRACKTAAEERAVIAKESALIRTSFKEQDNQYRHRNVAKLLFIHMLGYPSHFGQMECLKLIASPYFPEKRIGYLGLMLLLTDQEEVLTLVTNSLKNDLNHHNPFVVGLSLTAVGNIASPDIARDLAMDIDQHLKSNNDYLRKKAALAAIRMFKKVPDLVEDFVERILSLLKSRNHGVLLTATQLVIDIIELDSENLEHFSEIVPSLVRQMRNLLSMGYAPEYDVSGIADPFLQVKTLQLLRLFGKDNEEASDSMNDVLAQVATNTETAKNAGNAILYECVQTIMSIESESGLRVLAVNILGRFLLNRDNNIRYVALNTLSKVVADDVASVQRHRNTIVECLKDPDTSIRQRALELIYSLVNETNIRTLAREMLNYLVVAPVDQKPTLCSRIADAVDRYAPTCRWHIDTLITMLSIAGSNLADEEIQCSLISLIQQNVDLHSYVVHKLYWALKEDLSQMALVHVGVWCIGEYGESLMQNPPSSEETLQGKYAVEDTDIVDLLRKILRLHSSTDITKGYVLNAMIKLTTKIPSGDQINRIQRLLAGYKSSMTLELQQRAVEYGSLLEESISSIRNEVVMKMPVPDPSVVRSRKARFSEDSEDEDSATSVTIKARNAKEFPAATKETNLLDLDDIFGGGGAATSNSTIPPSNGLLSPTSNPRLSGNGSTVDLLSDIFSTNPTPPSSNGTMQPPAPSPVQPQSSSSDIMGLMDFGMSSTSTPSYPPVNAYEKNGLKIVLNLLKPNSSDPSTSHIVANFWNANNSQISNFIFQAAFPKYIKLQMEPPSSNIIQPNTSNQTTQLVKIQNTMHGQKPVMMRIKLQYVLQGNKVDEVATVNNFPSSF